MNVHYMKRDLQFMLHNDTLKLMDLKVFEFYHYNSHNNLG